MHRMYELLSDLKKEARNRVLGFLEYELEYGFRVGRDECRRKASIIWFMDKN